MAMRRRNGAIGSWAQAIFGFSGYPWPGTAIRIARSQAGLWLLLHPRAVQNAWRQVEVCC